MSNKTNMGLFGIFNEVSQAARTVGGYVKATRGNSISEFLGSTAVEPTCLVEDRLMHNEITPALLMNLLESFASMYIQVASRLTNVSVNGARVTRTLEKLATDRDLLDSITGIESESLGFIAGLESEKRDPSTRGFSVKTDSKLYSPVTDNAQLSVGKLIKLEIGNGTDTYDVPIAIRLRTRLVSPRLLSDIFKANHSDLNLRTIIRLYAHEEITLGEALTGSHIIKAQERVRLSDKDGLVQSHFTNQLKDAGYAALTGEIPINRASGITVITTATQRLIENTIRGKIDKFRDREKFFGGTASMILCVVDEEDELVHTYYRGFKDGMTDTFKTTARQGGKASSDLTPVVKDLLSGRTPSF